MVDWSDKKVLFASSCSRCHLRNEGLLAESLDSGGLIARGLSRFDGGGRWLGGSLMRVCPQVPKPSEREITVSLNDLKLAFKAMDESGKGEIEAGDVMKLLSELGYTETEAKCLFDQMDVDNNQNISENEFIKVRTTRRARRARCALCAVLTGGARRAA
jgi:hypothetical protein